MINNMNSLLLTDGYKTSHEKMYPKGTTLVFSNSMQDMIAWATS